MRLIPLFLQGCSTSTFVIVASQLPGSANHRFPGFVARTPTEPAVDGGAMTFCFFSPSPNLDGQFGPTNCVTPRGGAAFSQRNVKTVSGQTVSGAAAAASVLGRGPQAMKGKEGPPGPPEDQAKAFGPEVAVLPERQGCAMCNAGRDKR